MLLVTLHWNIAVADGSIATAISTAAPSSILSSLGSSLLGTLTSDISTGTGLASSVTASTSGTGDALLSSVASDAATRTGLAGAITSAVGSVKSLATTQLSWARELLPFANFVYRLPQTIVTSLQDNDYESETFTIANKAATDDQQDYGIQFNFGFEGSGSINDPFGFDIVTITSADGSEMPRFIFKTTEATLIPQQFSVKNADGTVAEVQRTDIRQPPFSTIIPTLLNQLFGQQGATAWSFVQRLMSLYPQDVAMFKIFSLMGAAYKNSATGSGYPRVAHVPLELSVLFARMAKTPDIKATQALYPAGTKPDQWDPAKIVFLQGGPNVFLNNLPGVLKDSVNQIQFPLYEGELQEYKDMQGKGLTQAQKLYGNMRGTIGYDPRTQFALQSIIPYVDQTPDLTRTDADLLIFGVKLHSVERLDSLNSLLVDTASAVSSVGGSLASDATALNITDTTLEDAKAKLAGVTGNNIRTLLKGPYDLLKQLLDGAQASFAKRLVSSDDITFLQQQSAGLASEIERLAVAADNLSKALLSGSSADFATAFKELQTNILDVVNLKSNITKSTDWGQKISQLLSDYLTVRYFQFGQLNCQKFDGDVGYFKDDSPMDTTQAVMYSMAVILRSMKDLMKGQELFKNDTIGQYMTSPTGTRSIVQGQLIYQEYMEKPSYYKNTIETQVANLQTQVEQQASTLATDAQNLGLAAQQADANAQLAKAQDYYNSLNLVYLQYLRQYLFDRRDLSGSFAGQAFDVTTLTSAVTTKQDVDAEDLLQSAQTMIKENNLSGDTASVRLDALVYEKQLQTALAGVTDNTLLLQQQGQVAEQNNLLSKYNTDLSQLQAAQATFQSKLTAIAPGVSTVTSATAAASTTPSAAAVLPTATASTPAVSTSPEQAVYQGEITKIAAAITQRKQDIATATAQLNTLKTAQAGFQQQATIYTNALKELQQVLAQPTLVAKTLDDLFPAAGVNVGIKEQVKKVQITDANFLQVVVKARALITTSQTSTTTPTQDTASSSFVFTTNLFEAIVQSCETALGITAVDSLLGDTLTAAKIKAETAIENFLNGQADFSSLENDFLAQVKTVATVDTLARTPGMLPAIARAATFALQQILVSSVGGNLYQYLTNVEIPKVIAALKTTASSSAGTTVSTTAAPGSDAVDALLSQVSTTLAATQPAATLTLDATAQADLASFVTEINSAVGNDAAWTDALWENDLLTKPDKLPLSQADRLGVFYSAVLNILEAKKTDLTLTDKDYQRMYAIFYMLSEAYAQSSTDLAGLKTNIETWLGKIKIGATAGAAQDVSALSSLTNFWHWCRLALPSIFSYARFVIEAGTKTSINQFLAREFANLALRAKDFGSVSSLYLDPILTKSLGVDTKTLLAASTEEQQLSLAQQAAVYSQELQGLETTVATTLVTADVDNVSTLANLAESSTAVTGTSYDMTQLEQELSQTAAAVNSSQMQFMLSEGDFNTYFNQLATDGANVANDVLASTNSSTGSASVTKSASDVTTDSSSSQTSTATAVAGVTS